MIRNKIKTVLIFVAITFLYSCTLNNEPGKAENESSVLFNLVANKSDQKLYLYRTAKLGEEASRYIDSLDLKLTSYSDFFIKNAEVKLEGNDLYYNDFVVVEDDDFSYFEKGFQYINNDLLEILPSTKYNLLINYDGINIKGETTTPGDFKIISPENYARITESDDENNVSFNIRWNKSKNAKGYFIKIVDKSSMHNNRYSFITADTTYNFKQSMHSGAYMLEILAYDENIDNYLIKGYNKSGLENAYGYFGSSVLKSIDFTVKN